MATETPDHAGTAILVRACSLKKSYRGRRSIFGDSAPVTALDNVDLEIRAGSTLALVGESGSGKSTLARCLARLERPDSGEIWFAGKSIADLAGSSLFQLRRQIQIVFQDSASALNPRFSSAEVIEEPMAIQRVGTSQERRRRVRELLERVGLPPSTLRRHPMDLSGGQRKRLAVARALAVEPKFLILDEAFAGLDLSIQAHLVNLLRDLQAAASLTFLYISHDLGLVAYLADEVAVMHQGRIVERGPTRLVLRDARHPHTRRLVESVPCIM